MTTAPAHLFAAIALMVLAAALVERGTGRVTGRSGRAARPAELRPRRRWRVAPPLRSRPGVAAVAAFLAGVMGVGIGPERRTASLIAGLVLACGAAALVRWLERRPSPHRPDPALSLTLDLAAAALRAGEPLPTAITLAIPAAGPASARILAEVAGLLRLGADPVEAWSVATGDATLARVARDAVRSSASGARLAQGWERLAAELRAERRSAALARAQRAGVWAMAPLGLCFLPAFICIGVVPVVVAVARGAFAGLGQ